MNDANATQSKKPNAKKTTANGLAFLLMVCGLGLLCAQIVIHKSSPEHGEQEWTELEQREFRELQTLVHQSPSKALPSGDAMSKVYTRMDALDAVRIERREQTATRLRWLRIMGMGLLCGGLALYFVARARED